VKDILHEMLMGLARWPLLLGAAICYSFVLWEEMVTDQTEVALATTGIIVGSVLLGGWLVSYIVAGEREHYSKKHPIWTTDSPPSDRDGGLSVSGGDGGDDDDGSLESVS
jgi:hypothetical protein